MSQTILSLSSFGTSSPFAICFVSPPFFTISWVSIWEPESLRGHARGAELLTLAFHERGVLAHVGLAGYHEVKFAGPVPEKLAMDPGPNEPAVGADVDLGNSEADHRLEFGRRDATGPIHPA